MQSKARPILFSGPMVRAILAGRKTQTRRLVKPQPWLNDVGQWLWESKKGKHIAFHPDLNEQHYPGTKLQHVCPYGVSGDRLWVRETGWRRPDRTPKMMREGADTWARYYYDADGLGESDHEQFKEWGFQRRPSIFMPRWASRITLEVVSARVERLQEISQDDAVAEGCDDIRDGIPKAGRVMYADGPRAAYSVLWDTINGPGAWDKNPFVWVVEFSRR